MLMKNRLDTSSSSGSASDATAEARDLVGILEDDSAVLEASWFRQSKKIHLVRDEVDSRPSPWCRDSPFSQEPVERGVGFTSSSTVAFSCCCIVVALVALSLSLVWTCIINNRHLFKSTHA